MAYQALEELHSLIKAEAEGKSLHKDELKPLLRIIAQTGFLPHTEESLNTAVDLVLRSAEILEDYVFLSIEDVDESIYKAGKKHKLRFTPEQVVKRIVSRTGHKEIEEKALEIVNRVKDKMKRKSAEGFGGAAVYIASGRHLTQRNIYRHSFRNENTIRKNCKEIGRICPEYSLDEVDWRKISSL